VIFVVSAILISVFITRMASTIKVRETTLAKSRENEIRNEQLVAIGTLAPLAP
jgi:two-component system sensor histidine kinase RegB